MRAKELVPILSEQFGIEPETGSVIDRSLAEKGLRSRGRGRSWPEMTRGEAIVFLLACMVTEKPTKAGDQVMPWVTATAKVNIEPPRLEETPEGRAEIADSKDWEYELTPHEERDVVIFWQVLELLIEPWRDADGEVGLVDYLEIMSNLIDAEQILPDRVRCECSRSHGHVRVTYHDENDVKLIEEIFAVPSAAAPRSVVTAAAIELIATVSGRAFEEIALRTSDSGKVASALP